VWLELVTSTYPKGIKKVPFSLTFLSQAYIIHLWTNTLWSPQL
jgi:hypothetical protein